jgi:hypothetical protein
MRKIKWVQIKRTWRAEDWIPTADPYVRKRCYSSNYPHGVKMGRGAVVLKLHALANIKEHVLR